MQEAVSILPTAPDPSQGDGRLAGRRSLFGAGIAVAGLAGGAAATAPVAKALAASPDDELIQWCAEFDRLEMQRHSMFIPVGTNEEWDLMAAEIEATIDPQQAPLVDKMCAHRCTTLEGFRALAHSLSSWDESILQHGTDEGCINDRLACALIRDLIGRA